MKKKIARFLFILLGFLLGCALSVTLLFFGVKARINYLADLYGFVTSTPDAIVP